MKLNKILRSAVILPMVFFLFTALNVSAQSNGDFDKIINDSYLEAFGRFPSDGERQSWIEPLKRKISNDAIIASHLAFMVSAEGENELRQTVVRSYLAAFGREPDRGEMISWINGIKRKGGVTFANIVSEHIDFMQGNAAEMRQTIIRSYQAVFKRQPSVEEINSWIQPMKRSRMAYWQLLIKHAQFLGADKDR